MFIFLTLFWSSTYLSFAYLAGTCNKFAKKVNLHDVLFMYLAPRHFLNTRNENLRCCSIYPTTSKRSNQTWKFRDSTNLELRMRSFQNCLQKSIVDGFRPSIHLFIWNSISALNYSKGYNSLSLQHKSN